MAQADAHVIIPRRGFLTRAFGFTAAGATVTLPIITMDSARTRANLHMRSLLSALEDLYPGTKIGGYWRFPKDLSAHPNVIIDRMPLLMNTFTNEAAVKATFGSRDG